MQKRGIFWTWSMNKSCTLWILDYIHMVRYVIAITIILYEIWILKLFCNSIMYRIFKICRWNLLWWVEMKYSKYSDFWRVFGSLILSIEFLKIMFRLKCLKFLVNHYNMRRGINISQIILFLIRSHIHEANFPLKFQ